MDPKLAFGRYTIPDPAAAEHAFLSFESTSVMCAEAFVNLDQRRESDESNIGLNFHWLMRWSNILFLGSDLSLHTPTLAGRENKEKEGVLHFYLYHSEYPVGKDPHAIAFYDNDVAVSTIESIKGGTWEEVALQLMNNKARARGNPD